MVFPKERVLLWEDPRMVVLSKMTPSQKTLLRQSL